MEQHLIGGITMREFFETDFHKDYNNTPIRADKNKTD